MICSGATSMASSMGRRCEGKLLSVTQEVANTPRGKHEKGEFSRAIILPREGFETNRAPLGRKRVLYDEVHSFKWGEGERNEKTSQRWFDGVDVWVAGLRDGFEENADSSIAK